MEEERLSILFKSRSGSIGSSNARNTQYEVGLETILQRLSDRNYVLLDAAVDSARTRQLNLSLENRRLLLRSPYAYPLQLGRNIDVNDLRRAICAAQRTVGSMAAEGGNNTKQICMYFSAAQNSPRQSLEEFARLLSHGFAAMPASTMALSRARQGKSHDAEYRQAVEQHAMRVVRSFFESQGYSVSDVSASQPYDLHCVSGTKVAHVEVKGTASSGQSITLTRNEVNHARENPGLSVLALVSQIGVDRTVSGGYNTSGGLLRLLDPFDIEGGLLTPTQYEFVLPQE